MKLQNKIMIIAGVSTLILFCAFWWYEWRPTIIRKNCAKVASVTWNKKQDLSGFDDELSAQRYFNIYYEICLHQKGL